MKKLSLTIILLAASMGAKAQLNPSYNSYLPTISIKVPTEAASSVCSALPANAPATRLKIKRTFYDFFDNLDLGSNRWTPHLDGGYDEENKLWQGYTWVVKRRQPEANEEQIYVDPSYAGTGTEPLGLNPFEVSDGGLLTIRAQKAPSRMVEALSGFKYTSGMLTSRKTHVQRYGYFEARIKVPQKQALLPAFWMLPFDKSWPPELDIMEAPSHEKDTLLQSSHWSDGVGKHLSSGCRTVYPDYQERFHQYGALWTPTKIVYYIDRVPVGQILTPAGMDKPMYMILNLAVGPDWVGKVEDEAVTLPAEMVVDNVVAYSVEGPDSCTLQENGVNLCLGD
ncbi:MAG: glycoside hydrolase family 16 protein [Pseudomonadota bacterium]